MNLKKPKKKLNTQGDLLKQQKANSNDESVKQMELKQHIKQMQSKGIYVMVVVHKN